MRPDWKRVEVGDPAYEVGVVKFWAPAYGIGDLRDLPQVSPNDHALPSPDWTVERTPNANTLDSRFIATRL